MFAKLKYLDVFNVPTIGLLAEAWHSVPSDLKILCPFYFGDLFDKDEKFKNSFVPICSTCLVNSKMNEGLTSGLSYDELFSLGRFEVKRLFLVCSYCTDTNIFHNKISDIMSAVISRKKVIPSDVLDIHITALNYFNLMTMGKVRGWEEEQQYLIEALSDEDVTLNLIEDDSFGKTHIIECDDDSLLTMCVGTSLVEYDPDYQPVMRKNKTSMVREYCIFKESPSFPHLDGTSFIYPLNPNCPGLGVSQDIPGITDLLSSSKIYPFEYRFQVKVQLCDIVTRKIRPFNGNIVTTYTDPYMKSTVIRDMAVTGNDAKVFEFYSIIRLSDKSSMSDYLNYHSSVYLNGYQDYFSIDFFHSLGKRFYVVCEVYCTTLYLDHSEKELIVDNPTLFVTDYEEFKFIKVKSNNSPPSIKPFKYYDHGEKVCVTNMYSYYKNASHQLAVQFKAYRNYEDTNVFSEITGYPILKKDYTGTDAFDRTLRFMCYRCFYHKQAGAIISSIGCECNARDSYSGSLICEMGLINRHPLRYYPDDFDGYIQNGSLKYVVNNSSGYQYFRKCQSCGLNDQNVISPLYTTLKYCRGCLINHCGLPVSLSNLLRDNVDLFISYSYDGGWSCPSCGMSMKSDEVKILSRCVHELKCRDCAGPLNVCSWCKERGCYV